MKLQRIKYAFGAVALNIISHIIISFFASIKENKNFWSNAMALYLNYKYIIFFSIVNIAYFLIVYEKLKKNIKQQQKDDLKNNQHLENTLSPNQRTPNTEAHIKNISGTVVPIMTGGNHLTQNIALTDDTVEQKRLRVEWIQQAYEKFTTGLPDVFIKALPY